MPKTLQIVSFDIPYPPNYGGIVDVYYKIRALYKLGYKIILHCFNYKHNSPTDELSRYCHEVHYYDRRSNLLDVFSKTPYIVISRKNKELLDNLLSSQAPILFEGLHCCYYAQDPRLQNHVRIIRMHNIEWQYYKALAQQEKKWLKKLFFLQESSKLKNYEHQATQDTPVLAINIEEAQYLQKQMIDSQVLEAFHPYDKPEYHPKKAPFVLFHGSLDVHENLRAAEWICEQIAPQIPHTQILLAGKNPSKSLYRKVEKLQNVKLVSNPTHKELQDLIRQAQINLIITFQNTGIKLKLLNALFIGGHCIANSQAIFASDLDNTIHRGDTPQSIIHLINMLIEKKFSVSDFDTRAVELMKRYNNLENAKKITPFLNP